MMAKKQKNFEIRVDIAAEFSKLAEILGLDEYEAAEIALLDWIQKHKGEAQKQLDLWAQKGIEIKYAENLTVNLPIVFMKAEVLLAKEELTKLLENLERGNPEYRREMQLNLAQALKKIQPVYVKTRDPELLLLLKNVEEHLEEGTP